MFNSNVPELIEKCNLIYVLVTQIRIQNNPFFLNESNFYTMLKSVCDYSTTHTIPKKAFIRLRKI